MRSLHTTIIEKPVQRGRLSTAINKGKLKTTTKKTLYAYLLLSFLFFIENAFLMLSICYVVHKTHRQIKPKPKLEREN
jgi:hypothetical protein